MDQVLILSGISGSGKSTAVKALEDSGFYCIDNLPPNLISTFVDLCNTSLKNTNRVALVIDIRVPDREALKNLDGILRDIGSRVKRIDTLFLECSDEAIVKRYKETRRTHPLAEDGDLLKGISMEREILSGIKNISEHVIDTSDYNVHQLKEIVLNITGGGKNAIFTTSIISFGYKHGVPAEADLVVDARFLPSPHFDENLKDLTGNDPEIVDFILSAEDASEFMERLCGLLEFLLPRYRKEGKSYLTVAVGCTGGKHRSVVIVNEIARKFGEYNPRIRHRDINKL